MQEISLQIIVKKAFGNLHRKRCVLIAVEDDRGNILLGAKPGFYPPTITRLLGGGVDEGEDIIAAVSRELHEELGIKITVQDLNLLLQFNVEATDDAGRQFLHQTFVYHVKLGDQKYQAGDDVKYIDTLTVDQLHALGKNYETLSSVLWYVGPEGEFSWADYGKMYPREKRNRIP